MKILAVDSTTEACSVALFDTDIEGGDVREIFEMAPREHSQRLLPMVDQLLSDNHCSLQQIDAIAYGRGPGSFTGLRICLGLVQGLAFGVDIPVVAVSSLAALAQAAFEQGLVQEHSYVVASLDARMNELYWGVYKLHNGLMLAQCDEQLTAAESLQLTAEHRSNSTIVGVGNGWSYAERIPSESISAYHEHVFPRASAIARLAVADFNNGLAIKADQARPTYIRDQVAWKKISEQ